MKLKLLKLILIATLGVILLTGCTGSVDIKGIKAVELSFSGEGIDEYSCVLNTTNNIKQAMKIYKELETFKSPESDSKYEEVSFKILYEDGKEKERVYVKVRPVAEIFSDIFKSKEVIKQWTTP